MGGDERPRVERLPAASGALEGESTDSPNPSPSRARAALWNSEVDGTEAGGRNLLVGFDRSNEEDADSVANLEPREASVDAMLAWLTRSGANHYSLEAWGPQAGLYRFQCQFPLANRDPRAARHFESTAETAREAVAEVVRQARNWQAGQKR